MVQIKKTVVESFIAPLTGEGEIAKVSLFLASGIGSRLTKLNLENLSAEERSTRLKSWGQDYRFVLVIEKGDVIFAHAHSKYAQQLQGLSELSLNHKKVKVVVKALSEEEAQQISAIGEAFENYVIYGKEEGFDDDEVDLEKGSSNQKLSIYSQEFFVKKTLMSDQVHTHFFIRQMVKRSFGNLISECMKRYQEAQRELKKQQEIDDKHVEIKQGEIKAGIKRSAITGEGIKQKGLLGEIVRAAVARTGWVRGAFHRIRGT